MLSGDLKWIRTCNFTSAQNEDIPAEESVEQVEASSSTGQPDSALGQDEVTEPMTDLDLASKDEANATSQPDSSLERNEMSDLELAYKDQGFHEMEFTTGNESDLHERKARCQKNPGHLDFIPAKKLSIEHLPEHWRDSLVFEYITTLISLTVRLTVKYTSNDRPLRYPLYNRRNQYGLTAFGSGWVEHARRKFSEEDGHTCPCETCKQYPDQAKKQWGMFRVETAKHVVFDTSEARHTKCNLFFDSGEDRHHCPSLEGVEVWNSHFESDFSTIMAVTHDEDVSNKLSEMINRRWKLRKELREKFRNSGHEGKNDTTVVISHPHGLSKHVTVGEVTNTVKEFPLTKHQYNAETCPGSSGGTVLILKEKKEQLHPDQHTHSGCQQKGFNESTNVIDMV